MTTTTTPEPTAIRMANDASPLVLRLVLGFIFVAHGSQKLFGAFGGGGIPGTAAFFESLAVQPATLWAIAVALVEFAGGIALAVGFLSKIAAACIAIDMAVAVAVFNGPNGFFVETSTGGWELNFILIAMCVSIILTGAGRYSIDHGLRPIVAKRSASLALLV
ncbi:DoxX family protein [Luethyella okanaganae]|uniref:DoxX family protein n=1 Tax=Luethyella okanaganae TaxID=69372 RepID=A0ABW1VDP1_9MICO